MKHLFHEEPTSKFKVSIRSVWRKMDPYRPVRVDIAFVAAGEVPRCVGVSVSATGSKPSGDQKFPSNTVDRSLLGLKEKGLIKHLRPRRTDSKRAVWPKSRNPPAEVLKQRAEILSERFPGERS